MSAEPWRLRLTKGLGFTDHGDDCEPPPVALSDFGPLNRELSLLFRVPAHPTVAGPLDTRQPAPTVIIDSSM